MAAIGALRGMTASTHTACTSTVVPQAIAISVAVTGIVFARSQTYKWNLFFL